MATYSSMLAWEIPWTEEPGGLQSMGSVAKSQTRLSTHARSIIYLSSPYSCLCCFQSAALHTSL